jgi:hypothetical protein
MNVNLTVIVQIVHFLIAYSILERFFFRYAVRLIQKRDSHILKLTQAITEQKNNAEILKVHVAEQWQRYQRALQHEVPSLAAPRIMLSLESLYKYVRKPLSKNEEALLSHEFAQLLIDKVRQ